MIQLINIQYIEIVGVLYIPKCTLNIFSLFRLKKSKIIYHNKRD